MPHLVVAANSSFVRRWQLCETAGFRYYELETFAFLGVAPRKVGSWLPTFWDNLSVPSFAGQRSNLKGSQLDVSDLVAEELVLIPTPGVYRNCGLDLARFVCAAASLIPWNRP